MGERLGFYMGKTDLIIKTSFVLSIIHIIIVVSSSMLSVLLFPFFASVFTHLDVIECIVGCSLSLMIFPEQQSIGFINLDNCFVFLLSGILFLVTLIVLVIFMSKGRRWAFGVTISIYLFDMLFTVVHYFALGDMIDLTSLGAYSAFSMLYKFVGVSIILSYLLKKGQTT